MSLWSFLWVCQASCVFVKPCVHNAAVSLWSFSNTVQNEKNAQFVQERIRYTTKFNSSIVRPLAHFYIEVEQLSLLLVFGQVYFHVYVKEQVWSLSTLFGKSLCFLDSTAMECSLFVREPNAFGVFPERHDFVYASVGICTLFGKVCASVIALPRNSTYW